MHKPGAFTHPVRMLLFFLGIFAFWGLVAASLGLAADDVTERPSPTLALPADQMWVLLIGTLVPLLTYKINHLGPHTSEQVKGVMHVVVAAVAAGLYEAINGGHVGFDQATLQYVLTAVIAALGAHRFLWSPSGIAASAGAGQNKVGQPPGPTQV